MRRLAEPKVVTQAALAAAMSAVLALPGLALWQNARVTLWYLDAVVFFGGFVMWAFVFAWHTAYTGRAVWKGKVSANLFAWATLAGVGGALVWHFAFDPIMRTNQPEEYPADWQHWVAATLFGMVFEQLFLLFAPFAWAVRLFGRERIALAFTVIFSTGVWVLKAHAGPHPLPALLFATLFVLRIFQSALGVWFYLQGGVLLVWWISLLVAARHIFDFLPR